MHTYPLESWGRVCWQLGIAAVGQRRAVRIPLAQLSTFHYFIIYLSLSLNFCFILLFIIIIDFRFEGSNSMSPKSTKKNILIIITINNSEKFFHVCWENQIRTLTFPSCHLLSHSSSYPLQFFFLLLFYFNIIIYFTLLPLLFLSIYIL